MPLAEECRPGKQIFWFLYLAAPAAARPPTTDVTAVRALRETRPLTKPRLPWGESDNRDAKEWELSSFVNLGVKPQSVDCMQYCLPSGTMVLFSCLEVESDHPVWKGKGDRQSCSKWLRITVARVPCETRAALLTARIRGTWYRNGTLRTGVCRRTVAIPPMLFLPRKFFYHSHWLLYTVFTAIHFLKTLFRHIRID